ncbi:SRPBCC family protein [Chitinophaga sp. 30R24]|uniref:SRPBCC family protein n=1 Tax=Chitinophaga sp. 30R24 TaxID=3248838 RepID=UPI003B918452
MNTADKTTITVSTTVNAPIEKVWKLWSTPEDIIKWNSGADDWHTPRAENDLRTGGKFLSRMEAKDGSMGFDFVGIYDEVKLHELIVYSIEDGRKVTIHFEGNGATTEVIETFEAESTHPVEQQRKGWQTILDNFKKYTETVTY